MRKIEATIDGEFVSIPIREYPGDPDIALLIWENRQLILKNIADGAIVLYADCDLPSRAYTISADEMEIQSEKSIVLFSLEEETRGNIRIVLEECEVTGHSYSSMKLLRITDESEYIAGQFTLNQTKTEPVHLRTNQPTTKAIHKYDSAEVLLIINCNIIGPEREPQVVIVD